ncbi:MAG: type II secretion system protein [Elusimicrobiaceae bacterium]|nr:type II secretion system protein [Elusimicrobiaceae bacterium]MBP5616241.1 type II secretion system protein [Elusimicrobiaceae bacterium]
MKTNPGFTLIELLVVVLIIGILAAVALPQYQFSVLKSRTAEALENLRTLHQAQELYFLEHGEYTDQLANLSITLSTDQRASSWNGTDASNPSKYMYSCNRTQTGAAGCIANAANASLPILQYNSENSLQSDGTYKPRTTKPYLSCLADSAYGKNATAEKICKQKYTDSYEWNNKTYYIWN